MKHTCDVANDELIAYLEEDLPELRMKQLEAHVPECPDCQEYLTGTRLTTELLRETMPVPSQSSRHDLLVRLYQEAEHTTYRPHRGWAQVASLTAVGGTFLLAAILLWSGLSQFVDAIPRPFQQASQDRATEWVASDDESAEAFENAPLPESLGDDYPLYDEWVQSGIRVIIYQTGDQAAVSIEVSQFVSDDHDPPGYMEEVATVDFTPIYVDDPDSIREIRWSRNGFVHHLEIYMSDPDARHEMSVNDVEQIVQRFSEE